MSIITNIGAIAASVINRKRTPPETSEKTLNREDTKDDSSKEQHLQWLKWVEEGKCQCCGAECGEYKGICDHCRFS